MKSNIKSNTEAEIILDEVFDFKKVDEFRSAYEEMSDKNFSTLCISFEATKYMDSSALGMLLNVQSFYKDKGVTVKITNTKNQIKKILAISRFDKRFEID